MSCDGVCPRPKDEPTLENGAMENIGSSLSIPSNNVPVSALFPTEIVPEDVAQILLQTFGIDDLAHIFVNVLAVHPQIMHTLHELIPSGKINGNLSSKGDPEKEDHEPGREEQEKDATTAASIIDNSGGIQSDIPSAAAAPGGDDTGVSEQHGQQFLPMSSPGINESVPTTPSIVSERIVQFSTAIYYVSEDEGKFIVDVARLGSTEGSCSVRFETVDGSAKAGQRYRGMSGTLTFESEQVLRQIEVEILQDDIWDATLDFEIHLSEPENCQLGRYLWKCRVRVMDDDAFPTNRFKDLLVADRVDEVPLPALMLEYCRMNFIHPNVRRGTLFMMLTDQIKNLYTLWLLILGMILVDHVLMSESEEPDDTLTTLLLIMLGMVLPFGFLYGLDMQRPFLRVGGSARKIIQMNLLRKYLNYEESVRCNVKHTDLMVAMTRDTENLVKYGYFQSFTLFKAVGRMFFFLIYEVFLMSQQDTYEIVLTAFLMTTVLPASMVLFLKARNRKTVAVKEVLDASQTRMLHHVSHTVHNCRLIMDYHLRPQAVDHYEVRLNANNKADLLFSAVMTTNRYLAPALTMVVVSMFTVIGGLAVKNKEMSLGKFLSFCAVFREIGNILTQGYSDLLSIQQAFPPLRHITRYMNLPLDVVKRKAINRQRRKIGIEEHEAKRAQLKRQKTESMLSNEPKPQVVEFAADKMSIWTRNLSFDHTWNSSEDGYASGLLNNCNFQIEQGTLIAFIGQRGEGKTTLLKILGGVLLSDAGEVFIPPQLRVFHVSQDALFVEGSLKDNLTMGCSGGLADADADPERIEKICRRLGLPETTIASIHSEEQKNWAEVLSMSQRHLVHVARGLVSNPEVLVLHKPTLVFDDKSAMLIFKALRAYVDDKGLEQDPNQRVLRRPRTCLCTMSRLGGLETADKILLVNRQGTKEIQKAEVTEDHLH